MENFVSVIVPVLNASKFVDEFLEAILKQTWDGKKMEIIIIDNGSVDDTVQKIKKYPVTLLVEAHKKGPYAARNLGLKYAKGTVFALTDVNKIPDEKWIQHGMHALMGAGADLAGGHIAFETNRKSKPAHIIDSITFNNNKKLVLQEGAAVTGNLFFYRNVLDKIGYFPENVRSGMDVWWTKKAVKQGFKLIYAENATVVCKPRELGEVLKKSFRVGQSHPHNLKEDGRNTSYILATIIRTFAPPKINQLKTSVSSNDFENSLPVLWLVAWLSKIWMAFGRLNGLIKWKQIKKHTNT